MREHQIIITLKAEQFQAVQRLFKSSGAKSMGIYVRQQLLMALGLEHGKKADPPGQLNIQRALGQLSRLHGEVQAFAAESLAQPYNAEITEPAPAQPAAPTMTPSTTFALHDVMSEFADAAEELADLALKGLELSPRRGILQTPGDPEKLLKGNADESSDPLQDILQKPQQNAAVDTTLNKPDADEQFNYVRVPPALPPVPPPPPPPSHDSPPPPRPGGSGHSGISGGPPPRKRRS